MKDATSLPLEAVGYSEQFVRCLHSLGVCFVRSLCDDQVDHLVDHLDVGHFEDSLVKLAETFFPGKSRDGSSAGGRLDEEVLPHRPEASGIDEPDKFDLPDFFGLGFALRADRHDAFGAYNDLFSILGDCDRRFEKEAVDVDELSVVTVADPSAGSRVGHVAVRLQDLKESVALNGEIQRIVRNLEVALPHHPRGSDDARPKSDLDARRER